MNNAFTFLLYNYSNLLLIKHNRIKFILIFDRSIPLQSAVSYLNWFIVLLLQILFDFTKKRFYKHEIRLEDTIKFRGYAKDCKYAHRANSPMDGN